MNPTLATLESLTRPSATHSPSDGEWDGVRSPVSKFQIAGLALLATVFWGCSSAKVTGRREFNVTPTAKPVTIYVADFDLDAADIKSQPGLLPQPPALPGPFGDVLPPLPGASKDPQKLARELVGEMSESLVKDFTKAGFTARRLTDTRALPASGWLVRGVFTDVNQGNQLRRAVIGFGAGKTDLQALVDIADLSRGTPRNFYELNTTADSGKAPGAAPTLVLGPAGVAARYVIAGNDLKRNVTQTASRIAEEVGRRATQQP
jgi:hypothetical protein